MTTPEPTRASRRTPVAPLVCAAMLAVVPVSLDAQRSRPPARPGTGTEQASPIPRVPTPQEVANQIATDYPMPVAPVQPVAPKQPSRVGPTILGLLAAGGTYVGVAKLCGETEYVVTNPLGGRYLGRYYPTGSQIAVPANTACQAGSSAGALVSLYALGRLGSRAGYRGRVAQYQKDSVAYPTVRTQYERLVAQRNAQLDSAVAQRVAAAQKTADSVRAQMEEAERVRALAANPQPANSDVAPAAPVIPSPTAPRTALRNPNAVAVVIGNARYDRSEVPPVDFAVRDARAMKDFLITTFGFKEENIIFTENARFSDLQRIFGTQNDFKGQLYNYMSTGEKSDVFVFYSGHGAPDPGSGTAYLVPADADPQSLRFTGFPVNQLYANLAQLPANSVTVVLDACFSGLTDRGSLLRGISPLTLRVENPVLAAPNAVVLSASKATEVSGWYDQQQHGLFTYVFLDAVAKAFASETPERIPTARELNEQVSAEVIRLSRRLRQRDQTPQVFGAGSEVPLPFVRMPQ